MHRPTVPRPFELRDVACAVFVALGCSSDSNDPAPMGGAIRTRRNARGAVSTKRSVTSATSTTTATEPLTVRYSDYQFGRPETIHYPDSDGHGLTAVRHNYGPHGHLLSVGVPQQTPFWGLVSTNGLVTDAFDLPIEEHFGNGAVSAYARDNLSRVRFMIDVDGDGSQIRLAALAHDAGGNVIARADANQLEALGYDQLDRLASSTISGTRRETHYDDLGNITFRTEVGPYAYFAENADIPGVFMNPIKPHAVTMVGSLGDPAYYWYDDAGQMIGRGSGGSSQQMSWTPFGKISQMWTGTGEPEDGFGVVSFGYDADGQRVLKTTEDETTTYMLDLYERRERADETEHVFFVGNDRRVFLQIAVRTDGNSSDGELAFLHGDVIGSPEVITGTDGSVVNRRSYSAFGAERDPNDWNDSDSDTSSVRRGFTGHEEDREYNLVNMIGRLYDARIGRFLSPDPLATLASSQELNRYSYVRNNPLKYIDPSGYEGELIDPELVSSSPDDTQSKDPDVEYEQWQQDAQADLATNETGQGTSPFSDPDAAANADVMTSDSSGTGQWSEAYDIWNEGANIVKNEALDLALDAMEAAFELCWDCENPITKGRAEQQALRDRQINRTEGGGGPGSGLTGQTREQLLDSRESFTKLIAEHKKKLADYIANPLAQDNKNLLKNAPSDAIREKIISGRINVLEGQIRKQQGELEKINKLLGE